jgi:vitamin B12 transporter
VAAAGAYESEDLPVRHARRGANSEQDLRRRGAVAMRIPFLSPTVCCRHAFVGLGLVLLTLCATAAAGEAEPEVPPPAVPVTTVAAQGAVEEAAQPAADPNAPLPVAPETTVVGRPGAFPAEPLPSNVAVTPSLTETPVNQVGSSLTVITGEQIRQSQKATVSEVLRGVPGLDVVQQGPMGSLTSVFMRGASSQGTKVLIDGMPANDPSNASRMYDFSTLTTDNVERIEVLRGPQSTLYGSDAVGGVVNIVTKRGEGPTSVRTDLMGGSYGTARETLNVSGGNKLTNYSFGAAYLQTDGVSAASSRFDNGHGGFNTERDGVRNATFSGRFGITPSEDFDVDYVFRYIDVDAKVDDYDYAIGHPVDNLYRQNRTEAFMNRVSSRLATLDGFWEHRVGFSYIDYDRLDTAPGPYDTPHFIGQTSKFDYRSNFNLAEWDTFVVGTDYQDEQSPTNTAPYTQQTDTATFFENQFRFFDRWFTTVGARWDDYSLAGAASTYRVTTRYVLKETGTSFHGSMGTAFRAPALAEYAWQNPNATLRPEQSKGWDCGIEQSFADRRFVFDTTYFRNDYTDLIQYNYATWYVENVGRAVSDGVELTGTWNVTSVTSLLGSYTYTYTEDVDTGLQLLRRAPHKFRVAVNRKYFTGRGNALLEAIYVGQREDTGNSGRVVLGEYWLVNAATTYDLTKHWQLLARLDNLLDSKYEEVYGYGTTGIAVYGGMSGHW